MCMTCWLQLMSSALWPVCGTIFTGCDWGVALFAGHNMKAQRRHLAMVAGTNEAIRTAKRLQLPLYYRAR